MGHRREARHQQRLSQSVHRSAVPQGVRRLNSLTRRDILRLTPAALVAGGLASAQNTTTAGRKKILALGEEKGYRHEAVPHALATIERLGRQNGLWDTYIRTDTEPLTKQKLEFNAKNLNDFDAVVFFTGGTLE